MHSVPRRVRSAFPSSIFCPCLPARRGCYYLALRVLAGDVEMLNDLTKTSMGAAEIGKKKCSFRTWFPRSRLYVNTPYTGSTPRQFKSANGQPGEKLAFTPMANSSDSRVKSGSLKG